MNTMRASQQHRCRSGDTMSITGDIGITTSTEHFSEHHHPHLWPSAAVANDNRNDRNTKRRRGNRPSLIKATCSPRVMAQVHNNHGVNCIECGKYDEAIVSLVKAFKFSQLEKEEKACDCRHCDLHSVITCNTASHTNAAQHDSLVQGGGIDVDDDQFLYSSGISIPKECHGHSMGDVLQVILSFNLALANHLLWINNKNRNDQKRMKRIMRLYELAYHLQMEENNMVNIKLTLIIVNNLSQIHYDLENHEKYQISMQHLLSNLLLVAHYQQQHPSPPRNDMNLEGFFANASRLILNDSTAAAA